MPTGNATEPSRTSFRGPSPRLAAAQPSNQASGEVLRDLGSVDNSGAIKILLDLEVMIRQEFG
jgi:hypothetical protein